MKTAYHFFLQHAGFSWNPVTQTRMQGRIECAQRMAAAETAFFDACRVSDVEISWEDDPDGCAWSGEDYTPERVECAAIWHRDESGRVRYLASLCGIDDADANYRRVIRAELALECIDELRALAVETAAA
jgi:hypothetical protein